MKLKEMTWLEVEALDKTKVVVVLPLGALEQHGHHLPLGVDTFIVESISEHVESEIKDHMLLLPTLWLGHSPHHMHFPGTVSIHHELYSELILQSLSSLVEAGFTRFTLLNGHGGNGLPMQIALQELKNKFKSRTDLYICAFHYWNIARDPLTQIRQSTLGGMGHACEMETSVMQYLYPALVKSELATKDGIQPNLSNVSLDMLAASPIHFVFDFHEISKSGTFGDPTLANSDKGERFFQAIVKEVIAFIREWSLYHHSSPL